jgi:hypothetical protein
MTTQVQPRQQSTPASQPRSQKLRSASPFIWVCLIFVVLNFVGDRMAKRDAKKHPSNENARAVLANYKSLQEKPEVVLLGSSVVRFPFWLSDLKHSNNVPKFNDYSFCEYLQKQVAKRVNRSVNIFDMGIDAEMVSDAYLICEKLFIGKEAPRLIVYGINPRDFMDALLPSDTGTLSFARLHGLNDLSRSDGLFATNMQEKTDLFLQSIAPLYQYRREWQDKVGNYYLKALPVAPPYSPPLTGPTALTIEQKNLAYVNRAKLQDGEWIRSIAEYEARWAKPSQEQFQLQSKYLDALLALTHERRIKVLLIKMPVTETNESLMPPGLVAEYDRTIAAAAKRWNLDVLDLRGKFRPSDDYFFDIVHLNARGGDILSAIFAEKIAQQLTKN